jgi:hypothetical protein
LDKIAIKQLSISKEQNKSYLCVLLDENHLYFGLFSLNDASFAFSAVEKNN